VKVAYPFFEILMNLTFMRKLSLPLGSIFLSSVLLWGSSAKANDISVTPMVIESQSRRGQSQGIISVSNLSTNSFRARVFTTPFTYDKEKGYQALPSSQNDLAPYMQFSPKELQINGSTQRNIRYVVRLRPDLPDGEYRTMIFTESLESTIVTEEDKKNNVQINTAIVPRIGVAVYVRKGNIAPNINAVTARFNSQAKQLELLVDNTGKATAFVGGHWTLKRKQQTAKTGVFADTTVMAEGGRYLTLVSNEKSETQIEAGEYELSGELEWGENKKKQLPFRVNVVVPKI
jgi:hypothetical protein